MEQPKTFILVDTSYWIFYRYYAILQWWNHAKTEQPLPENHIENEEFLEKFTKTFLESLTLFKKKLKLHKEIIKGQSKTIPCPTIIAVRDCPRKDIWRNKLYEHYKGTRAQDNGFNGGPFFKFSYQDNNKLLYEAGVKHILQFPNLEADDIIAIVKQDLRAKYPDSKIYIIANDHDYLQLLDEQTEIINFQYKFLKEAKKVFEEPEKNLFYKIVLGDKSDNINPVFKKCGPKTCEKYYANKEAFNEALLKEAGAREKYELNRKLVSFTEIPQDLITNFKTTNNEVLQSL
jgi:5'-3' exonuclease|uniref:5'-3' exonuclease domain-containing protein n=1 Tax=viral metagenome TaxID=1070528 RepID=A0A6C0CDE9_9ZZZZ